MSYRYLDRICQNIIDRLFRVYIFREWATGRDQEMGGGVVRP